MAGRIDDCDLDSALVRQSSAQSSLADYGSTETFVGIVHSPNDKLRDTVDRNDRRLAPPSDLFTDWRAERQRCRNDGLGGSEAHNRAFDSVNYRDRYRRYLDDKDHVLDEYADRIHSGETIVLVCFCENGQYCHRHIAKDCIFQHLDE